MKAENLIGKILSVNGSEIFYSQKEIETELIPAVETLIVEYDRLELSQPFSNDLWKQIIETEGRIICDLHIEAVKLEIQSAGLKTLRPEIMKKAEAANESFLDAYDKCREAAKSNKLKLTDVKIVKGHPKPDLSRIEKAATLTIETPEQAEVYSLGLAAEKALNTFIDCVSENTGILKGKLPIVHPFFGLFTPDKETGELVFNPDVLARVKGKVPA